MGFNLFPRPNYPLTQWRKSYMQRVHFRYAKGSLPCVYKKKGFPDQIKKLKARQKEKSHRLFPGKLEKFGNSLICNYIPRVEKTVVFQ